MTVGMWASFAFREPEPAMAWLKAVGFKENVVYRDDKDSTAVVHAEYTWPAGGGLMFGSVTANPRWPKQPGTGATYLVTPDVDGTYAAALAAGGTSLAEPYDEPYGRSAAVRDPEGNLWSFGTYDGE